jgi:hypothetical protein
MVFFLAELCVALLQISKDRADADATITFTAVRERSAIVLLYILSSVSLTLSIIYSTRQRRRVWQGDHRPQDAAVCREGNTGVGLCIRLARRRAFMFIHSFICYRTPAASSTTTTMTLNRRHCKSRLRAGASLPPSKPTRRAPSPATHRRARGWRRSSTRRGCVWGPGRSALMITSFVCGWGC